jgi:hypothetical protein
MVVWALEIPVLLRFGQMNLDIVTWEVLEQNQRDKDREASSVERRRERNYGYQ